MDKTLAQKITENTKKVVAEREAEKRGKIKKFVYGNLEEIIRGKALEGKRIFFMHSNELRIGVDSICSKITIAHADVIEALKDIGFEVFVDSQSPLENVIRVPEKNVSEDIQKLLDMYNENLEQYENSIKKVARKDCADVLKKLEYGNYTVDKVNQVSVEYTSSLDNEMYKKQVKKIMQEYGFEVFICLDSWVITVIENEGD